MEFDEYIVDLNADCKCGCRDYHRLHNIYHLPNDLGASVVANPKKAGFDENGYRALIIRFSGPETYSKVSPERFPSNPVECADWDEVIKVLRDLKDNGL